MRTQFGLRELLSGRGDDSPDSIPPAYATPSELGGLEKAGDIGIAFNPDFGLAGGLVPFKDPARPGPGCSYTGTGSLTDPADFESYMDVLKQASAGSFRAAAGARLLRQEAQRASLLARGAMGALLAAADGPDRLGSTGRAYKPVRGMGLDVMDQAFAIGKVSGSVKEPFLPSSFLGVVDSGTDSSKLWSSTSGHGRSTIAAASLGPGGLVQRGVVPLCCGSAFLPPLATTTWRARSRTIKPVQTSFILSALKGLFGIVGSPDPNTRTRKVRGQEWYQFPDDEPVHEGLTWDYRNYENIPRNEVLPNPKLAGEKAESPWKKGMGMHKAASKGLLGGKLPF